MTYERLCAVCDHPMIDGQAFNGLLGAHWDCAPGVSSASAVAKLLFPESALEVVQSVPVTLGRSAARLAEKGPTFAQIFAANRDVECRQVEARQWEAKWRVSENGKTRIGLECPFCYAVVETYLWSLPNGKRCLCGAMHGRVGSTHWAGGSLKE